ncbi:MAG: crossover junction endodeoxyribonuclease RuvC, partial [Actinobacteria bacterium]|nr:crossover junction endodeoxyribonuclease RuvC [Actinomycetota bacterium]
MKIRAPRRVLGIDPGITRCGYGLVEGTSKGFVVVTQGALTSGPDVELPLRLAHLYDGLEGLLQLQEPGEVALERVFMNLHKKTGVASIQAAGVAMLCAARCGASVFEYSPVQVKQAVVGN